MKYCNVQRPSRVASQSCASAHNIFNRDDEPFETLGSKILRAINQGADLGSPVPVSFDEDESSELDILADANHDLEDIQEKFGNRSEVDPASQQVPTSSADQTE